MAEVFEALELCYSRGIPFAAWRLPGSDGIRFAAAPLPHADERRTQGFFAAPFAALMAQAIWIDDELSADEAIAFATPLPPAQPAEPAMPAPDTDAEAYIAAVQPLIARLNAEPDRKAVISTLRTEPAPAPLHAMARALFANSPADFCYCLYHPAAGAWLGASPEVLLCCDTATGHYSTMALAGTTAAASEWDSKNLRENAIVSQYIQRTLLANGASTCHATGPEDAAYGPIKHLKVSISGSLAPGADPLALINALNPTPALCGNPRDYALSEIAACEAHQRQLYGGCIGVMDGSEVRAYVNIRCARYAQGCIAIFAGGGIMPDSDPKAEWHEACAKAAAIKSRISSLPS